jgi:hypothetical protein
MKIQEGEGNLMKTKTTPLFNDGMDGLPSKRVLQYVEAQKAAGRPVVGIYCGLDWIGLDRIDRLTVSRNFDGYAL